MYKLLRNVLYYVIIFESIKKNIFHSIKVFTSMHAYIFHIALMSFCDRYLIVNCEFERPLKKFECYSIFQKVKQNECQPIKMPLSQKLKKIQTIQVKGKYCHSRPCATKCQPTCCHFERFLGGI